MARSRDPSSHLVSLYSFVKALGFSASVSPSLKWGYLSFPVSQGETMDSHWRAGGWVFPGLLGQRKEFGFRQNSGSS